MVLGHNLGGLYSGHLSTFGNDLNQREKLIFHLQQLLEDPLILTMENLVPEFLGFSSLRIQTIEALGKHESVDLRSDLDYSCKPEDVAVLMLTSGSTGNAKAVALRHNQILQAVSGKSIHHQTTKDDVFLNWIGLDHVANLTEIHLHALYLGSNQIHVQAANILAEPLNFLRLVEKHQVTYTFAPNFFLAALRRVIENTNILDKQHKSNLSSLRAFISGGEAVVVDTCIVLSRYFRQLGARGDFIRPGFGMTETCAGSVYGRTCPTYDLANGLEFASLGSCIPGMAMRVILEADGDENRDKQAPNGQVGYLQLKGPVVFHEYYNNPKASSEAFTKDGWFKTGDMAYIDAKGNLNLAGRAKEDIIINGVHFSPHMLECALHEATIPGITPSYVVVFGHRPQGFQTEVLCIVYLPTYQLCNTSMRVETLNAIRKVSIIMYGVRPFKILPLEEQHLQKSSLGKLSRTKIRRAFEAGAYARLEEDDQQALSSFQELQVSRVCSETERIIIDVLESAFSGCLCVFGVQSSLFDIGITSVELIRFKYLLEKRLGMEQSIPLSLLLANPTVQAMANALETIASPKPYNPVVILQPNGTKTPLWLIHPGVGEVLVFLNLAKYFLDRPLYALRARGFNPGEAYFSSIPEIVSIYHKHIKECQPSGPYAIAGYSFGTILAFEVTKILETNGDEVKFLGSFNLPPHIRTRMRQLDHIEVMVNLSYFLGLISEDYATQQSPGLHQLSYHAALDYVWSLAPHERLIELSLSKDKLENWTRLAYAMQNAARDYDPSGSVAQIDVFYAEPLAALAMTKEDWLREKLWKWNAFIRSTPRFHPADGAHYTMLAPEHVHSFQRILKSAIAERGL